MSSVIAVVGLTIADMQTVTQNSQHLFPFFSQSDQQLPKVYAVRLTNCLLFFLLFRNIFLIMVSLSVWCLIVRQLLDLLQHHYVVHDIGLLLLLVLLGNRQLQQLNQDRMCLFMYFTYMLIKVEYFLCLGQLNFSRMFPKSITWRTWLLGGYGTTLAGASFISSCMSSDFSPDLSRRFVL